MNDYEYLLGLIKQLKKKTCCCEGDVAITTLNPPVDAPSTNGATILVNTTLGIAWYWDGDSWEVLFSARENIVVSGAAILSLLAKGIYVFTGTTSVWALPTGTVANVGLRFVLKNRGSGGVTVNVSGGSSTIYESSAVASIVIPAGEARDIVWDGTYWIIL